MARADHRKVKIGIEDLEGRNLTSALATQAVAGPVGVVTVNQPAPSLVGVSTLVLVTEPTQEPWTLNPNPEDPKEPRGPGGPVIKVGIIAI